MKCWFTHNFGFPHREVGGTTDMQTCRDCGYSRVAKAQLGGQWRPGVSSEPLLTADLEREIEFEQAEIRRKEAFWA